MLVVLPGFSMKIVECSKSTLVDARRRPGLREYGSTEHNRVNACRQHFWNSAGVQKGKGKSDRVRRNNRDIAEGSSYG